MKLNLIFLIFFSLSLSSRGQKKDIIKEIYSVEELKQDFDVFRTSLEEGHPGLYLFKSKTQMDSIFEATSSSITHQMTNSELMIVLCKVVAQIGDGHLKVVPPKVKLDSLDEGATAIPFRVYYADDKLYVQRNYSTLSDKEFLGAQIIAINGHSITDFIKEFLLIFPSDGNNVTHKYRLLSSSRYFTRYFFMLYGYSETYEVQYISQNETTVKTSKLQGLFFDKLNELRKERYPEIDAQKPAEFSMSEDKSSAYLRITTFDKGEFKKHKMDYEKFLKKSFEELDANHISNLIIDVRDNGGGTDEYGKILFSYFINHEFDYYKSLRMNKESFNFFQYTNRPDMKAPKGMLKANSEGTFDNIQHPNVGIQHPSMPTFTGNIYALINGWCFSTTSEFLSLLQFHTKAIFIGEESGGNYYGNCSGPTPDFTLPNSKIRIEIPLMNYRIAVKDYQYTDRGIIPNYTVLPTAMDKINNVDLELEFTNKLIKK
ncbi:MAG: hypothetical protein IPO27_11415 [Bacteroidetes bacterium]|nr:hypothetical protein [Bacteroidota bacterium]